MHVKTTFLDLFEQFMYPSLLTSGSGKSTRKFSWKLSLLVSGSWLATLSKWLLSSFPTLSTLLSTLSSFIFWMKSWNWACDEQNKVWHCKTTVGNGGKNYGKSFLTTMNIEIRNQNLTKFENVFNSTDTKYSKLWNLFLTLDLEGILTPALIQPITCFFIYFDFLRFRKFPLKHIPCSQLSF